jgi:serine/threonine protein kinase
MRFRFEKTLGEGAYGKVKTASLIDNPGKKFAIKSIPRKLIDFEGKSLNHTQLETNEEEEISIQEYLEREIVIVLDMDHPNIIKFY